MPTARRGNNIYQNIFITSQYEEEESKVYLWDDNDGVLVFPYREFQYAYKKDPKGKHISIYGERLKKTNWFRWDDPTLYESDLPRETRVLTDLYLDSDESSTGHVILNIDIEVDSTTHFASAETAENPITAIANHDSSKDHYTVFLLDPTGAIKNSTIGNETLISCKTEDELLKAWLEYYHSLNVTIITGWNVDGYDIPYLYNRLKRCYNKDTAHSLSPIGIIRFNQNRNRYIIAGVAVLDYMVLYKKFTYSQKPSYRLDAICQEEIGEGKITFEGTLATLYRDDLVKFVDYNLNDVKLVVKLDRKMKLIELARFICHMGHVPYEDFEYSSKFIEGTIVTYLHRKGIICSNKPKDGQQQMQDKIASDKEGFAGAFVKVPYPDLYEWVYSLDLQSLYPSIIMSLNISPETKLGRVFNWNVDKHIKGEIDVYEVQLGSEPTKKVSKENFNDYISDNHLSISSNGILYTNDKVGIIPEILDQWFKARAEYKSMMIKYEQEGKAELAEFYDRRQHVQKILLNSIYGVLGLPIFRFYDIDNALAVTASGQDVIKTTAKYINKKYQKAGVAPKTEKWLARYRQILISHDEDPNQADPEDHCVYIDTDSVYFSAKPLLEKRILPRRVYTPEEKFNMNKSFTIDLARKMEAGVNQFYDVVAKKLFNCDTHRFYIKGESVMETGFWVAKKRYAMKVVYDLEKNLDKSSSKPKVKGLDVVRSSFPPAFAKFMSKLLMDILNKGHKADLDKSILDFYASLPDMNYLLVARNTAVKKVSEYDDPSEKSYVKFPAGAPAHSKAAVSYNRFIRNHKLENKYPIIRDGDKIKYVYLKKNPYALETMAVKTYDDPPQIVELIEKYIDHDALYETELAKKLSKFYDALNWGLLPTEINQVAFEFFNFN